PSGASSAASGAAMVPVRSVLTQPVLPSVLPMRLWPRDVMLPPVRRTSGPLLLAAVFPATIVLPKTGLDPPDINRPPPPVLGPSNLVGESPLTVQLVSVTGPSL